MEIRIIGLQAKIPTWLLSSKKASDLTATFSKKKTIKSVQEFLCSALFIFIAGWAG